MHKDPQRRYGTVDALMRDVDHYEGSALEARTDTVRYRLDKFLRRNGGRSAASAVFVVFASLIVSTPCG